MKKSTFPWILAYLGLVGIAGVAAVVWATANGPNVGPDSVAYLEGAKGILSGQGYASGGEAITHFPPLFSILLAVMGLAHMDMVQAARFLNALLFGTNLVLLGLATYLATDRDLVLTATAPLLLLLSGPLLFLHTSVFSEPLFIALALSTVILVPLYIARRNFGLLVVLAIAIGLSSVARYIGLALIPAILIVLLMSGRQQRLGQRIRDGIIFVAIACAPMALFMVRNELISGAPTDRHLVLHPASLVQIKTLVNTLYALFVPLLGPGWLKPALILFVSAILGAALIVIVRRRLRSGYWDSMADVTILCCLLLSASYSFFLLVSISLFDAQTPLDARLLSAVFVWLIVGLFGAMWALSAPAKAPYLRWGFASLILLAAIYPLPQTVASASRIHKDGQGYTARRWEHSQTMEFVKALPEDAKIYSNGPDVINFLSLRRALFIPRKQSPSSLEVNNKYSGEVRAVCNEVRTGGAYLVHFKRITWRWYLPSSRDLNEMCHLPVLRRFKDGKVYGEP